MRYPWTEPLALGCGWPFFFRGHWKNWSGILIQLFRSVRICWSGLGGSGGRGPRPGRLGWLGWMGQGSRRLSCGIGCCWRRGVFRAVACDRRFLRNLLSRMKCFGRGGPCLFLRCCAGRCWGCCCGFCGRCFAVWSRSGWPRSRGVRRCPCPGICLCWMLGAGNPRRCPRRSNCRPAWGYPPHPMDIAIRNSLGPLGPKRTVSP